MRSWERNSVYCGQFESCPLIPLHFFHWKLVSVIIWTVKYRKCDTAILCSLPWRTRKLQLPLFQYTSLDPSHHTNRDRAMERHDISASIAWAELLGNSQRQPWVRQSRVRQPCVSAFLEMDAPCSIWNP